MELKKVTLPDLHSESVIHKKYINITDDYNINLGECQQSSTPEKEIVEKFEPKKLKSELLAYSYKRLGLDSRASRVIECGTFLEWVRLEKRIDSEKVSSSWRLHNANFCRDRLCPMCSWRRSYKIFGQVSQIMDCISDKYAYLFLTLTVPNCAPKILSETIDNMQIAWHKLIHYKRFKVAVKGFFKALEITRNSDTGDYHPHFHVVIAVSKRYFKQSQYISHDEWLKMWQKATKNNKITQVDVRRAKQKMTKNGQQAVKTLSSAIAEIAKYAVKSSDYIIGDDLDLMDKIVLELTSALHGRRLCSFGGIFDEFRKKLALDDVEDGDLVHINGELNQDIAIQILRYSWSTGVYKLVEIVSMQ